ncbi:MAG: bifunctional proline dehydrogenase/L-glutamate gamma-semialdehyde dehydrogenase PutA [Alphaproteobacteria bacterium]|nr:bifunctional proline dehydrogenase/L-glutamate gamma-semialdehyde dehydrogenase PutA [Alphaproteobacteria bacterium]
MIFDYELPERSDLRQSVAAAYRLDETEMVERLLAYAQFSGDARTRIADRAEALVRAVRARPSEGSVEAFMHEYELSSHEGIVLMCLAEALLRVPDDETVDKLIQDKITSADWGRHLGHSGSLFVNASTWGFMLTGSLLAAKDSSEHDLRTTLTGLLGRTGEPIIRQAIRQAMRILGRQFIMGETIEEGLHRARSYEKQGYRFSYDMLGEAARTNTDAEKFFDAYAKAIDAIAATNPKDPIIGAGLSVKLSALDPRYEFAQHRRTMSNVLGRLKALAIKAKQGRIGLTVDAEEADRLEPSLDIIEALAADPELAGWNGFGLALQTYQKRAFHVVDWLADLGRRSDRRFMVRLVKGAYWDTEIKRAQEAGEDGYPVFTRKASTDLSYIACVRKAFECTDAIYPQFATHNAQTASVVLELAGDYRDFEFQRLHGMSAHLHDELIAPEKYGVPVRVYAPCGGHKELLPYLVRRLLENGANTSFVNRIMDESVPLEKITGDPVEEVAALQHKPHPRIPLPRQIYAPRRLNSMGVDLTDERSLRGLAEELTGFADAGWSAGPIVDGSEALTRLGDITDPADRARVVGGVQEADEADVAAALDVAEKAFPAWRDRPVEDRAAFLERAADLFEANTPELMAIAIREAGKTLADAVAEVREAVDFCRYYAVQARRLCGAPTALPAHGGDLFETGGRGIFVCISPWNFPLAIFTGQIAAALAVGNAVIAKPAEQTSLMAARAVRLLHEAGIPPAVLQLLPGRGEVVGARLVADPRVAGVAFTGGTDTALAIRRTLAAGPIGPVPLIAETGGQNAMIVDSTALPEQAIGDVLHSAFDSAGQRCSALRVLFLQDDIAPGMIEMLAGAMSELRIGDPSVLSTDVGPVIDDEAKSVLEAHGERMAAEGTPIHVCALDESTVRGTFFGPRAYEIDSLDRLHREVFGPVLHVIRFAADRIDQVVDRINATGYGLTFGVHSRIDSVADRLHRRIRAGNTYVNRNIIGAIVGVQPFGGEGLSGTGPKAGGPNYLRRFAVAARATGDDDGAAPTSPGFRSPGAGWQTSPIVGGRRQSGPMVITHPASHPEAINGTLVLATQEHADEATTLALAAFPRWEALPADHHAVILDDIARELVNALQDHIDLCVDAAGIEPRAAARAIEDAATLCRAYAAEARASLAAPLRLRGYTGERDELSLRGRGLFLCIVEGAAPIATIAGMVAAASVAGNGSLVIAGEASAHLAARLVARFHASGMPPDVLHFLPIADDALRDAMATDPRIAGIAFAGTEDRARDLDRILAAREGPIIPLIVERSDIAAEVGFSNVGDIYRFATERSLSIDTTASGGNASLFSIEENGG